ncbi:hypothetical protein DPMN_030115 [Dreissena polymorpha]|uniref:Uncharacterized protein n=1 Tax=Dreissena polymorpha TaxID=45954 RepID=A0A9D4LZS2_DREPO|nr:hypothetical protein DPMN_030115 [Dreissena polymorpha]
MRVVSGENRPYRKIADYSCATGTPNHFERRKTHFRVGRPQHREHAKNETGGTKLGRETGKAAESDLFPGRCACLLNNLQDDNNYVKRPYKNRMKVPTPELGMFAENIERKCTKTSAQNHTSAQFNSYKLKPMDATARTIRPPPPIPYATT